MNHFIYHDHKQNFWVKDHWEAPTIFECDAELLTDADKLMEAATGINPAKAPYIGCEIKSS